jgi:hypothetical protein
VRSEILVRRILGASFLGLLVISALGGLGIAPFLWITRPLIVSAVYSGPLSADNISAISTSRDGPPFNGAVFRNTTFQVNITFTDVISVTTYPRVNITLRLWDSPDKNVLRVNVTNVTAWPINPFATAVRLYNTTVFINASGVFIGNLTGTSTDLRAFISVIRFTAAFNLDEGNLLELGNFSKVRVGETRDPCQENPWSLVPRPPSDLSPGRPGNSPIPLDSQPIDSQRRVLRPAEC